MDFTTLVETRLESYEKNLANNFVHACAWALCLQER